jgi:GT2 family glycosyltransferase
VSAAPEVAVVVPAHGRPLRLRWLLNALEEQTLGRERFEIVVATTQAEPAALAASHPVGVRVVRPRRSSAAAQRNAGWRAAVAPLVAFTDDDCRPPAEWLERLLSAACAHPGAVVQGATRPDPDEDALAARAPRAQTMRVAPPTGWGETCNILYPRAVLEALGGFDERFPEPAGEDTDLVQRAAEHGTAVLGAPDAVTFHAVEVTSLLRALRGLRRWRYVPAVVKRHPALRRRMPLGIFWKPRHAWLALALAGLPLARRHPLAALALALPWARSAAPSYGRSPRGLLRSAAELPARALLDGAEMAIVARGAAAERTVLL